MEDMEAMVYLLLYVSFCHTQSKEKRNRIAVTLLLGFKNIGFDSCVGRLMTLPTPAIC